MKSKNKKGVDRMKHLLKRLLIAAMLLSVAPTVAEHSPVFGKSFFLPVANNGTATNTLGWSGSLHKFDMYHAYGCIKVQAEYSQNTKRNEIGQYIGSNGTNSMIWGPAETTTANLDTDVYALNFLLRDQVYKSRVTFTPKAQDFITSFGLFVGLDEWIEGSYINVNFPIQHARWKVVMDETTVVPAGATTYPVPDVVDQSATVYTIPYTTVKSAFKGDKTVADASVKWSYGRIDGSRSVTKLGDVHAVFGWDFINKDDSHFGAGVKVLLGAGGKSKAEWVFEPMVGYSGRQGLGGAVNGGTLVWEKNEDHNITLNVDGSAVHLFANEQKRSYDIANCGIWSRYLLVKKMSSIGATASGYSGIIDNFINIGTLKAKIGIDVVYDAGLSLCYRHGNTSLDVGYKVAGHSKEKWKSWVDTIELDTYILYQYNQALTGAAVSATNEDDSYASLSITGKTPTTLAGTKVTQSNKETYIIDNERLDKDSALAPSALEHCVYFGLNHNWRDSDWAPGLGVFASYHVSGKENRTFNRWTIGWQGNLSF
jgi:hypothetical protein